MEWPGISDLGQSVGYLGSQDFSQTSALGVAQASFPANSSDANEFPWTRDPNISSGQLPAVIQDQSTPGKGKGTARRPQQAEIRDIIFEFLPNRPNFVEPIAERLDRDFSSIADSITGFRVGQISLPPGDKSCPVVQWKEGHDREAMALFSVEAEKLCSCLIHYGEGRTWRPGIRWRRSWLKWTVTDFEALSDLFAIATRALGLWRWPETEMKTRQYEKDVAHATEEA